MPGVLGGTGTVGNNRAQCGTFAPGNARRASSYGGRQSRIPVRALYLVHLNPATSTFANVTATASLNCAAGGHSSPAITWPKQYSKNHPTASAASAARVGRSTRCYSPADYVLSQLRLTTVFLNLDLHWRPPDPAQRQTTECRERAGQFRQQTAGIPAVFASLTPAACAGCGRTAHRRAQTFQPMNLFMGVLTRLVHRPGAADAYQRGRKLHRSSPTRPTPRSAYTGEWQSALYRVTRRLWLRSSPAAGDADPFVHLERGGAGYGGSQTHRLATRALRPTTREAASGGASRRLRLSFCKYLGGFADRRRRPSFKRRHERLRRSDLFQSVAPLSAKPSALLLMSSAALALWLA